MYIYRLSACATHLLTVYITILELKVCTIFIDGLANKLWETRRFSYALKCDVIAQWRIAVIAPAYDGHETHLRNFCQCRSISILVFFDCDCSCIATIDNLFFLPFLLALICAHSESDRKVSIKWNMPFGWFKKKCKIYTIIILSC